LKTINSVSDFALIHYGWNEPILNPTTLESDPGLPGRLIKIGAHFISFQRSKSIGGSATIDFFSTIDGMDVGDWVVLKISSDKTITQANYAKTGIVKFIGQISSLSMNHFADADGNLRTTSQMVVREWSHALNMPVKYDQLSSLIQSKQFTQLTAIATQINKPDSKEISKLVEKYLQGRYNPFQATELILSIAGAISSNVVRDELVQRFESSNRLPAMPKSLLNENIVAFAPGSKPISWFSPWDSGAIAQIIGVQSTNKVIKLEEINSSLESYISALQLEQKSRPGKSFDRSSLNTGFSISAAIIKAAGSSTLYEMYTDLVFTQKDGIWSSTPAIVVRDKPISYRKIWNSQGVSDAISKDAEKFKWTFVDFVPRVSVDAASVISIGVNQSIAQAFNFLSFSLAPQSYKAAAAESEAKANGVRANVPSQFRYGTQVFEETVQDYIVADKLQDVTFNDISGQWFQAMSLKALNFYTHHMLFPTANLHIKDIDYPISVGNMISIVLPTGVEIVGEVEKINAQIKVLGDGKHVNNTYLEISKLSMVDSDNLLMPIPPRVLKNLLKVKPSKEDKEKIFSIWKFRE